MHKNREISSTPWSDDQGRSAKATSRTLEMYVPEKSDCAVVPMNQPNKGGQPSAEAGEGRAQTRMIQQASLHVIRLLDPRRKSPRPIDLTSMTECVEYGFLSYPPNLQTPLVSRHNYWFRLRA